MWQDYETFKQTLVGLTPQEYEKEIKNYLRSMEVDYGREKKILAKAR